MYRSQDTVLFIPAGLGEQIALCRMGDVMGSLVEVSPSVQIQKTSLIGSRWQDVQARGNATYSMSFAVLSLHPNAAVARAFALDLQEMLTDQAQGEIIWLAAYQDGEPKRQRRYKAVIESVSPRPMTSDHDLGDGARVMIEFKIILTK